MKLKLTRIVVGLLFASQALHADEPKPLTIAVLNTAGPHRTLANNISALLTANLSADERFSLVDRTQLDKVLGEQALGNSGNINRDTAAKIGQLTGAKVLVSAREMMPTGSSGQSTLVIIANVISTETGKVYSQQLQGTRLNVVNMVAELSQKVAQTIVEQSTNLVATASDAREKRLEKMLAQTKGKKLPAVSIRIEEKASAGSSRTAETELGLLFQKAGFTVVDEKSEQRPDVIITGDAITGSTETHGDLVSCPATLSIKAQERTTGKILSLDLQQSTAVGVGDQTTVKQALQNAADER